MNSQKQPHGHPLFHRPQTISQADLNLIHGVPSLNLPGTKHHISFESIVKGPNQPPIHSKEAYNAGSVFQFQTGQDIVQPTVRTMQKLDKKSITKYKYNTSECATCPCSLTCDVFSPIVQN